MEPKVKYIRIDEILGADINPKDHDIGVLITAIKRFGFTSPLIRNDDTKKLVAGHGRLEALINMYKSEYSLPRGILKDEDGMWLVPVVTGLNFENEEEALSYLIADNKLSEIGGWDEKALLDMLKDIDNLEGVGFDHTDAQEILDNIEADWEADDTDRGLGDPRIKYRMVFDDTTQQGNWFKFLEWLKDNSDINSVSGRLVEHVKGVIDE
tara:strand:- start:1288 stop:1917 length:630 start_codon:yes stop_codon:yes gene_type:complete